MKAAQLLNILVELGDFGKVYIQRDMLFNPDNPDSTYNWEVGFDDVYQNGVHLHVHVLALEDGLKQLLALTNEYAGELRYTENNRRWYLGEDYRQQQERRHA